MSAQAAKRRKVSGGADPDAVDQVMGNPHLVGLIAAHLECVDDRVRFSRTNRVAHGQLKWSEDDRERVDLVLRKNSLYEAARLGSPSLARHCASHGATDWNGGLGGVR